MSDTPLDRVLQLVAEGRLTAEEAAPILDALGTMGFGTNGSGEGERVGTADVGDGPSGDDRGSARFTRIEVKERGRRVVDLRIPISLGRLALNRIPGLSSEHLTEVQEAVVSGARGPILDIEDADGDGVRIVLE